MSCERTQQHAVGDTPELDRPVITTGRDRRAIRRMGHGGHGKVVATTHPDDVGPLCCAGPGHQHHDQHGQHDRDQRHTQSSHEAFSMFVLHVPGPTGPVRSKADSRHEVRCRTKAGVERVNRKLEW